MASEKRPTTTTDSGVPATNDERSLTVGPQGPTALHDHYVVQKMQHFNRERVPERVVHAKGSGAHGFFETTEDVSQFTKAGLFQPGTRTPMFARFSTVAGEQGSPDTARDPRGFALKFYTERGQLRPGRQQHAGLLRPRRLEVPGLHPLAEAPPRHRHALERDAVGLLDALAGERASGDDPDVGPWRSAHLSAHERLRLSHLLLAERGRREVLGQVPLQDGPGDRELHRRRGGRDGVPGSRRPPPRPAQGDRRRRRAGMEARGAGDAVRRGARLSLQPVRPDQGLAALRLPGDPGRPDGPRPQSRQLLRRGRAVRLLAGEPGAGDRAQPRQDADGTDLQLPRHASASDRCQLRAAADQLAEGRGPLLQLRRADDLHQQGRPAGVRAELEGRPGRRR